MSAKTLYRASRALAVACVLFTGAQVAAAQDAPQPNTEGLVEVKVAGLQQVLAVPDADLSRYKSVMLDPIEVTFHKSWDPRPAGRSLDAAEKTRIRKDMAEVLRKEFVAELGQGGYRIVDSPGDDVLRVRAEIRDLYINAPDVDRAATIRTYTRSTGEMTLVAELRDSVSGSLIAKAVDRRVDPDSAWFEWTTRIDNAQSARRAAEKWARALRSQLDVARASLPRTNLESDLKRP